METAMEDDTAPKMETEVKVKFEIPEKKVEPEKTVLQVVEGFKTGNPNSQLKYKQICRALSQLNRWNEEQKIEFLTPFLELATILDTNCVDIVKSLCDVTWTDIPSSLLPNFFSLFKDICYFNPGFVDFVIKSCVRHLFPLVGFRPDENGKPKQVMLLDEVAQSALYGNSLECIYAIVSKLPPAMFSLSSALIKQKPHYTAPIDSLLSHVRNTIVIADKYPQIFDELYGSLIVSLLQMDGMISQYSGVNMVQDVNNIFLRPESEMEDVNEMEKRNKVVEGKLDACLKVLLCYFALSNDESPLKPEDCSYTKWLSEMEPDRNIFSKLLPIFESHILFVHEMDNVPFLWFVMCSYSKENLLKLMKMLWKNVITPTQRPNEFKKTHNAVAFMGGILARAKFINFEVAKFWLRQMTGWCLRYMDKAGQVKRPGGHQHGTFYSVFQSILLILCYRYKEFVENNQVSEIRLWGVGRIVHSQLEPLNYVVKPLAQCFASISRYMQIVYCSHIVGLSDRSMLECYFPFLRSGLPYLSESTKLLLRHFAPADDDLDTLQTVSRRERKESEVIDEYDFMFVEDVNIDLSMDFNQTALTC